MPRPIQAAFFSMTRSNYRTTFHTNWTEFMKRTWIINDNVNTIIGFEITWSTLEANRRSAWVLFIVNFGILRMLQAFKNAPIFHNSNQPPHGIRSLNMHIATAIKNSHENTSNICGLCIVYTPSNAVDSKPKYAFFFLHLFIWILCCCSCGARCIFTR